jgi:hypothetical protein
MGKRTYITPKVKRIELDNIISLQMQTQPADPTPRGGDKKSDPSDPFESPFDEKSPF